MNRRNLLKAFCCLPIINLFNFDTLGKPEQKVIIYCKHEYWLEFSSPYDCEIKGNLSFITKEEFNSLETDIPFYKSEVDNNTILYIKSFVLKPIWYYEV